MRRRAQTALLTAGESWVPLKDVVGTNADMMETGTKRRSGVWKERDTVELGETVQASWNLGGAMTKKEGTGR